MKLTRIRISDIKGSVYQPRSQADVEIQQLVDSIIKNGLINPLIVREKKKDVYEIVCGNRRYNGLVIIQKNRHPVSLPAGAASVDHDGKISVQCVVIPSSINTEDASINALVENIERLDLTPLERARCYQDMIENLKISQRKLADRLNVDHAVITRLTAILDLPKIILEAERHRTPDAVVPEDHQREFVIGGRGVLVRAAVER